MLVPQGVQAAAGRLVWSVLLPLFQRLLGQRAIRRWEKIVD